MKKLLIGLAVVLWFSGTAFATTTQKDFNINLDASQIVNVSDGTYLGNGWSLNETITPIVLQDGDSIFGTVTFNNSGNLIVSDDGGGFFKIGSTTGYEKITMQFNHDLSQGNIITNSTSSFEFLGVQGNLSMNFFGPKSGNSNHYGLLGAWNADLVNTGESFSYTGFNYEITLNSGGPVTVEKIVITLFAESIQIGSDQTLLSCVGFDSPFAQPIEIKKKTKKAIPAKIILKNNDDSIITGTDISAPPVINVEYEGVIYGDGAVNDASLEPVGASNEGNSFNFNSETHQWEYRIGTSQFSTPGTYTVSVRSGDESEYTIDSNSETCINTFTRQD